MTEDEAKKKTCPFIAMVAMQTLHAALTATEATGGETIETLDEAVMKVDPYCLASECMMWDFYGHTTRSETEGDCGLKK